MVFQWATKRLLKFLLKRLNRFLYDEIDIEQLDVQLGSGIGELKELVLNAEYISDQLKCLPVILKSGSIARIVVRLPCEIEVDGLELTAAPRLPDDQVGDGGRGTSTSGEDAGVEASTSSSYSGVSDGVRLVGQIIKSLLLGLRVKLTRTSIRIEGVDRDHITMLVPHLEYGYEDSKEESENVEKVVKVSNLTVSTGDDRVPLFGEEGVSFRIRIGVLAANTAPKIELDIRTESISFQASVEEMKQLVSVTSAFVNGSTREESGSVYHDTSSFYESSMKSVNIEAPKCSLPVIFDWMQKPELSELDASMDEFFECLDQSAASSGLWQWTCSALGAASTSGTCLASEDIHVECSVHARVGSLSAVLHYTKYGEGLELLLKDMSLAASQELKIQIRNIEVNQLRPSAAQRECFSKLAQTVLPGSSKHHKLSEDLKLHKIQILSISSLAEQAAATMLSKKTRTEISLSLQPLVLWLDDDVVEKTASFLAQLQVSPRTQSNDDGHTVSGKDQVVEVRLPTVNAFFSAASKCKAVVALHLGTPSAKLTRGRRKDLTCSIADGSVYAVGGRSPLRVLNLIGKASCEVNWTEHNNTGPSVAKKLWDSVAVHAKSVQSGSNSDFASATTLKSHARHSALDLLKATSALRVSVSITNVGVDLSTPDHVAALELVSQFGSSNSGGEDPNGDNDAAQSVILVNAREAVVSVSNTMQLEVTKLKITHGHGLGGYASASYFQLCHGDGWLTDSDSEVVSCKETVIGRGDGWYSNALSTGSAGLALTVVSWPGKEQLADVLVTGHINGVTLMTKGGEFGWLPFVTSFIERCTEPFQKKSEDRSPSETSNRTYFFFDLHDAALRYEPSLDPSSTGCVLAATSLRVSSGEGTESGTSCYYITSREMGLHLVDRKLRKFAGDAKSLQQEGYVKVAETPVFGATVTINSRSLPSWVLESSDSQLQFNTCSDTTAAFGQLVSDIQRLFTPEMQETAEHATFRMKEAEGVQDEEELEDDDAGDGEDLFKGLVENAFTPCKVTTATCSTSTTVVQEKKAERNEQLDSPFIDNYYLLKGFQDVSGAVRQQAPSGENDLEEASGGWYGNYSVDVVDAHVPIARAKASKMLNRSSSHPEPAGKVVFTGWNATWKLNEGSDWQGKRSSAKCVEVSLSGLDVQYDSFAPTEMFASCVVVEIHEARVYDCGENAPWKLMLGYYHRASRPRESMSKAVKFRMDAVRPNPLVALEEYRISLALLPIRIHLDQEHLDFFTQFFSWDSEADEGSELVNNAILPFFQVCEMRTVEVRIDYVPRRLNFGSLRTGNFVELLNLCSWKGVELKLKSVHTSGVYGWSSLMGLILGQWLQDISLHQIPLYLRCAAPIRPVCNIGSGAAKLFTLPAKQYKKDKRFFKGIRKGAIAFVQSLSVEALGLGANLAAGAHHILSHTEAALGGEKRDSKRSKRPPSGPCEGLKQAYSSLSQGLEKAAVTLVANPVQIYQRGEGAGVAVANVIRASPAAILAPASAAAQAVRDTLLGVRNGLDPVRRRDRAEERRR